MNVKTIALIGTLAIAALSPACGDGPISGPSAVTGTAWKLQRLEVSGTSVAVSRPDNYTLEFRDDLRVGIKADCNVCGGNYSLSSGTLVVSQLACTLAYCGTESNDTAFLAILNGGGVLTVNGNELRIDSTKGTARLSR